MKISGVVILYHPTVETVTNIRSYERYLDLLYVIDNSPSDEISQKIEYLLDDEKIVYHSMGSNKGISQALNYALNKAMENGADYLLTMDQDSRFPDEICKEYFAQVIALHKRQEDIQTAIYAPNPDTELDAVQSIVNLKMTITSGSLMHIDAFRKIGMFDEDLFIDWVDQDICYRARRCGFKIQRLNWIPMIHQLGIRERINVGPFSFTIVTHSASRYYYMVRNKFYVLKKNRCSLFERMHYVIGTMIFIGRVAFLEKDKKKKLRWIYRGFYDYKHQVKGKKCFT